MNRRIICILSVCLTLFSYTKVGLAENANEVTLQKEDPSYFRMVGDLVVARPLLIAATVVGSAIFIISSPFSMMGGNTEQVAEKLVLAPARSAFTRCLGCTQ